jgi:hypothetical protein
MRDPTVSLNEAKAIDAAERHLRVRHDCGWFKPTRYDLSDIHLRAESALYLGGLCLCSSPLRLVIKLRPETESNLPAHVRDRLCALEGAEPKLLPRGRGRYGKGMYGPRNVAIRGAVKLALRLGFNFARNPAQRDHESACSIVRKALKRLGVHLSESHIARICDKGERQ